MNLSAIDWTSPVTWAWTAGIVVVLLLLVGLVRRGNGRARYETVPTVREETTELPRPNVQPLTPGARARYREAFDAAARRFVDAPDEALATAENLLHDVLRDRGYPPAQEDRMAGYLAAEDAMLGKSYRAARDAVARNGATTEEKRRAFAHYEVILSRMLDESTVRT